MSRISEVVKNKNRVEKLRRSRRKDELDNIRTNAVYRARLTEELNKIDILLESDEISYIVISVPTEYLAKFGAAIYQEELASYDIQQINGNANKFRIRRRIVEF